MSAGDDPLAIRGRPPGARRFSRRALIILLALAGGAILSTIALAMSPKDRGQGPARELYSTTSKPTADGLAGLPASYGDLTPAPALGPRLNGDVGAGMIAARQSRAPERGDAEARLAELEAERLAREADLARAATTSGVFFASSASPGTGVRDAVSTALRSGHEARLETVADRFANPFGASLAEDPGRQARKLGFLNDEGDPDIYNPFVLETPASPHQVMAGTIIAATLLTGLNSDLPGQVVAQVSEPVYDTVTGQTLLIPQGARLIGRYDSLVAYGQSRALLVWTRIVMPDGSSIRIDNLPALDVRGYAGLKDKVDHHAWRLMQGVALSTVLSVGAELARDEDDDIARAITDGVQGGINDAGQQIVRRQLNVQPTLTIRPGWRLRIIANKDIILRPYQGG